MAARNVAIVVYPGVQSLDVTGPFEVFAGACRAVVHRGAAAPYDVSVVAHRPGPVTTSSGLSLARRCASRVDDRGSTPWCSPGVTGWTERAACRSW